MYNIKIYDGYTLNMYVKVYIAMSYDSWLEQALHLYF